MAKRINLGRGLDSILSDVEKAYENNISRGENVIELDISEVKPNPLQPRKIFSASSLKELSQSIAEHGLLQPIVVCRHQDDYVLIAGERRLRASKMAGKTTIRAVVAKIDLAKIHELALIENIQREDLNPMDLAQSYHKLIEDYGITHEELAARIKKSRSQVTNTLRLLALIPAVQKALMEEKITQGHAKVLVNLDEQEQEVVLDSIVGQKLSVADVEHLVRGIKQNKVQSTLSVPKSQKVDLLELRKSLESRHFKIKIKGNQLSISFNSQQEVQKLLTILQNSVN